MPSPQQDALATRLTPVLDDVVRRAGFDLEDVDVRPAGRRRLIRVIVDSDNGVGLDDIADLSRAISAALDDQDDVLGGPYTLEVTSPGVDRPLTMPRHWRRARFRDGSTVDGRVGPADDEAVDLLVEGRFHRLSYPDVDRAVVQVEFREPPAEELRLLEQAERAQDRADGDRGSGQADPEAVDRGRAGTAAKSRRN
jgi:ribosome maturation factor RimP